MEIITIIDEFGRELEVDKDTQKVYLFDNKKKTITYSAQIVKNGKATQFWTKYQAEGIVDDVEVKIKSYGNPVILRYAAAIGFNSAKNDSDNKIWNKVVQYVKEHPKEFFTKEGNWRKHISVDAKKEMIEFKEVH